MEKTSAIILASGEENKSCKVLYKLLSKPMISWVYENCKYAGIANTCLVVSDNASDIINAVGSDTEVVAQTAPQGTFNAVLCASEFIKNHKDSDILVVFGDAPLQDDNLIKSAYNYHKAQDNAMTIVSTILSNPTSHARILRDAGKFVGVVEDIHADDMQKKISEVDTGLYWFSGSALLGLLGEHNNCSNITDLPQILQQSGLSVDAFACDGEGIAFTVNNRKQLAQLNEIARNMVFDKLWENGVDIPVADGIVIGREVQIGRDTTILPNTTILGNTTIGSGCVIGPSSYITDSSIGDDTHVKATWVSSAVLENDVQIGPFSQVRPNSRLCSGVRIGDFVEIKNSVVGKDTHASHLTYIGDTDCGERVNFGCGVVTVNYNGKSKNRTTIGDDCFVGCNTNLVAPVTLANGAYTAAGSTVTIDVPEDAMCIARAREVVKEGMAKKYRKNT